jgi:hypothetical protein
MMRPNRRPKLFLPLFLTANGGPGKAQASSFPLTPDQLRRTVAEMIG